MKMLALRSARLCCHSRKVPVFVIRSEPGNSARMRQAHVDRGAASLGDCQTLVRCNPKVDREFRTDSIISGPDNPVL